MESSFLLMWYSRWLFIIIFIYFKKINFHIVNKNLDFYCFWIFKNTLKNTDNNGPFSSTQRISSQHQIDSSPSFFKMTTNLVIFSLSALFGTSLAEAWCWFFRVSSSCCPSSSATSCSCSFPSPCCSSPSWVGVICSLSSSRYRHCCLELQWWKLAADFLGFRYLVVRLLSLLLLVLVLLLIVSEWFVHRHPYFGLVLPRGLLFFGNLSMRVEKKWTKENN
jgi:hypothetical protein